jgi:hypothetical protein
MIMDFADGASPEKDAEAKTFILPDWAAMEFMLRIKSYKLLSRPALLLFCRRRRHGAAHPADKWFQGCPAAAEPESGYSV